MPLGELACTSRRFSKADTSSTFLAESVVRLGPAPHARTPIPQRSTGAFAGLAGTAKVHLTMCQRYNGRQPPRGLGSNAARHPEESDASDVP